MAKIQLIMAERRMVIEAQTIDEHGVCLKLPSKKWMQKLNRFIVPINRMNVVHLLEAANRFRFPEGVRPALEQFLETTGKTYEFPKWYVYKTQPDPHQREAIHKGYQNHVSALFMGTGTGKSKTIIDICTAGFYERRWPCVVVFAPVTVCGSWLKEIPIHCPCPYKVWVADSAWDWTWVKPDQTTLNWILVGTESMSQGGNFDRILPLVQTYNPVIWVDESSDIKTPEKIRTDKIISLRDHAKFRGIASGLPLTKNLMDLYTQYEFLDPEIIGASNFYSFRGRYAIMGGYKRKQILGYDNVQELVDLLTPFTYHCTTEVLNLVPARWTPRHVKLEVDQRKMYDRIKAGLAENITVENVLTRALRLQQVTSGWVGDDEKNLIEVVPPHRNPKLLALEEFIQRLDESESMVLWSRFIPELDAMVKILQKYGEVAVIDGRTPRDPAVRGEIVQQFQDKKKRFFAGTQMAGGVGITLTAAHYDLWLSNTQNLKDRVQSEARTHRRGQAVGVLHTDILAENTVDTKSIMPSIEAKRDLAEYFSDKLLGKADVYDLV